MQFFLYEVLARLVGVYVCYDCGRTLWSGLVEGRISYTPRSNSIFDILFPYRPTWTFERDAAPIRYWTTIGVHILGVLACILLVIFGWFHPES